MSNDNNLADGTYPAHLAAAQARLSASGQPMIEFLWQIDGTAKSIKSFLLLTLPDGSPNERAVAYARRWAPDWDGQDPYWFAEHVDFCRHYAVKLGVKNEPWWKDRTRIFPAVKWVAPAAWTPPPAAEETPQPRPLDVAALADLPEDLEPTMKNAWSVFSLLYAKQSVARRTDDWLALVKETVPGKDQLDFTEEDWACVIALLRTRTHTCA